MLERLSREAQERAGLESSLSALNTGLRGNMTVAQVAERGLAGAVEFLARPWRRCSSRRPGPSPSPCRPRLSRPRRSSFAPGSGIVGQSPPAPPIISEPGEEQLRGYFGFGPVVPCQVVAWPLVSNEAVVGVLEASLFQRSPRPRPAGCKTRRY